MTELYRLKKRGFAFWSFVLLMACTATWAQGQTVTITGKVTDAETQQGLPGASVLVSGTTNGTITDTDGNFSLRTDFSGIPLKVTISFIGYVTTSVDVLVTNGSATPLKVAMQTDIKSLDEVVVTALGISQQKKALGYSTQEVKGSELAETQRPNFLVSLQGRIAGLSMTPTSGQPGSSVSISLRGVASIGGSNQPLIVIDGLPIDNRTFNQHTLVTDLDNRGNDYTNRAGDMNPNDIESITVLKGPEGAALYGQDGATGVIIITTKKGASGSAKVTYDNNFAFQKVYRFPTIQKEYGRGTDGRTDINSTSYFGPKYAEGTKFYDNVDEFFETGRSQTHNLGLEGGNDRYTYRLSTNYLDQHGTIPTSHYQRLSTKLTGTMKIGSKMEATTSLNYISSSNVKPIKGRFGFLIGLLSHPVNDDATNFLNDDGSRKRLTSNATELDNPFYSVDKNHNEDRTSRILANFNLNYNPVEWLTLTGRFGADIYSTLGNYYIRNDSYVALNGEGGGTSAGTNGFIDNFTENSRLLNSNVFATAKKKFGLFQTSLMVGGSLDDRKYEVTSSYGANFQLQDFNSLNVTTPATRNNKQTIEQKRLLALFGSFTASYKEMLFLTITGRNDWSSTMPESNRSYFYPSVQTSFVFTELPSLSQSNVLSFGKIRASYAEVGKDAPAYKVKANFVSRNTTGGGFAYGFFAGNTKLRPEKIKGYEGGVELKFLNNRVGVDLAVYRNDREEQIVSQRLSYGTGFVFGLVNGGSFSNQGYEIQLNGTPIKENEFRWDVLLNFSQTRTKVISTPAEVAEYYESDTWVYGNARASAFPENLKRYYPTANLDYNKRGEGSATAIGGYSYLRNNNGDILIDPTSGLPLSNTNFLPIGERMPDFTIGLTNTFTYKNMSLSFVLDIRKGGDVFNGNEMYLYRNGLSTRSTNRETPVVVKGVLRDGLENTETPTKNTVQITPYTRGSTYYNSLPESEFVEKDINWVRLRDVTLNYHLPKALMTRAKAFKTASIFITGNDLFLITNYTGADPSVNSNTSATNGAGGSGMDFGSLALPRSYSFGIRASF